MGRGPTPPRLPQPDDYVNVISREDITFLKRKNSGGRSNRRGSDYEVFCAVYLLSSAVKAIREKRTLADARRIWIASQVDGYIDDFAIATEDSFKWYEMKSGSDASWAKGDRPIRTNFELQKTIDDDEERKATYTLLIAHREVSKEILAEKADEQPAVNVVHFPGPSPQHALRGKYRDILVAITRPPHHDIMTDTDEKYDFHIEDVRGTYFVLHAAITHMRASKFKSIDSLVRWCHEQSASIEILPRPHDPAALKILEKISGLNPVICKNRLQYQAGRMIAYTRQIVGTREFRLLEKSVRKLKPKDIAEFNAILVELG